MLSPWTAPFSEDGSTDSDEDASGGEAWQSGRGISRVLNKFVVLPGFQEDYGELTAYDGQMKIDIDFVVVVPHRASSFLARMCTYWLDRSVSEVYDSLILFMFICIEADRTA